MTDQMIEIYCCVCGEALKKERIMKGHCAACSPGLPISQTAKDTYELLVEEGKQMYCGSHFHFLFEENEYGNLKIYQEEYIFEIPQSSNEVACSWTRGQLGGITATDDKLLFLNLDLDETWESFSVELMKFLIERKAVALNQ